jgi:triacylglycerol lipase
MNFCEKGLNMQRNATTRYPILLVHGLFGFERIGHVELFRDVKDVLKAAGNRVFVPHLSATHKNEIRGEQLLTQIEAVLRGTGASKVNLIGHSQGALAARYAAALAPHSVASVTSVSGPNHGSELADFLRKALIPGRLPEIVAQSVATLFADLLSLLSGSLSLPQNAVAALNALTTEGVGDFNDKYPQGLPQSWGGQGPA